MLDLYMASVGMVHLELKPCYGCHRIWATLLGSNRHGAFGLKGTTNLERLYDACARAS